MNEEKELLRSTYKLSAFDSSKPLVLTTERLIMGDESIKLVDILEAYAKTSGIFVVKTELAIRLKDGKEITCVPKAEQGKWNPNIEMVMKANVDRWVTLINRVLASIPIS